IFYLRKPSLFCMLEKFKSIFNVNIDQFLTRKISEKTFRFEFNENTYLFCLKKIRKIFRSVFYENTNLFLIFFFKFW
ncbi:hypothetical protein, partial [Salmonella sp. s36468]|uniref:hypothetical protein n=1 Tax=Salmonella sp. s36468 TaxID=3159641 RepID=UPI00397FC558